MNLQKESRHNGRTLYICTVIIYIYTYAISGLLCCADEIDWTNFNFQSGFDVDVELVPYDVQQKGLDLNSTSVSQNISKPDDTEKEPPEQRNGFTEDLRKVTAMAYEDRLRQAIKAEIESNSKITAEIENNAETLQHLATARDLEHREKENGCQQSHHNDNGRSGPISEVNPIQASAEQSLVENDSLQADNIARLGETGKNFEDIENSHIQMVPGQTDTVMDSNVTPADSFIKQVPVQNGLKNQESHRDQIPQPCNGLGDKHSVIPDTISDDQNLIQPLVKKSIEMNHSAVNNHSIMDVLAANSARQVNGENLLTSNVASEVGVPQSLASQQNVKAPVLRVNASQQGGMNSVINSNGVLASNATNWMAQRETRQKNQSRPTSVAEAIAQASSMVILCTIYRLILIHYLACYQPSHI